MPLAVCTRWISAALAAVVALFLLGGCAAIPLSALGSVSSLGDSNVSVGRDAYSWGKLRSAELVQMFDAEDAARLAAHDLGLHLKESPVLSEHGRQLDMAFVDDQGMQIGVRIDERSRTMCMLREDVGWVASLFGAEIYDRLFLLHLRQHLPAETKAETRSVTTRPTTSP